VPETLIQPVIERLAKLAASTHWKVKARDKNMAARVLGAYIRLSLESVRVERETVSWHVVQRELAAMQEQLNVLTDRAKMD
jgi:hypothetical protein